MKTKISTIALLALLSAVAGQTVFAAAVAEQPLTVNIKRLSLDTALRIGKAAIDKCRKEGVQIAVTVVDRGGHAQVMLRDVLAMDLSIPISKMKAYTAMSFNAPTSDLANRFEGAYSVPKVNELIIAPGGVPISVAGNIMGGIGVSGAPSGLTDEVCAKAGLAAVLEDLELE